MPVVVVIRTRGASQFQAFPLLTRVDAGNVTLAAGGLTDEELVALAASGNVAIDDVMAGTGLDGLDDVATAASAETKLAAATEAFLVEVGTVAEYSLRCSSPSSATTRRDRSQTTHRAPVGAHVPPVHSSTVLAPRAQPHPRSSPLDTEVK